MYWPSECSRDGSEHQMSMIVHRSTNSPLYAKKLAGTVFLKVSFQSHRRQCRSCITCLHQRISLFMHSRPSVAMLCRLSVGARSAKKWRVCQKDTRGRLYGVGAASSTDRGSFSLTDASRTWPSMARVKMIVIDDRVVRLKVNPTS